MGAEGPALKPGAALLPISMNGTKRFSPDGGRRWDFHPEETYKSLITISVEALKTLALVNGGAAVAILAFLGNLASRTPAVHLPNMTWALVCFAGGLFLTVLAFIVAYLTQLQLYNEDLTRDSSESAPGAHSLAQPQSDPLYEKYSNAGLIDPPPKRHAILLWIAIVLVFFAAIAFAVGCIIAASTFANAI